MNQAIIYNQDNGMLAVVHPSQEAVDKYGIDEIAKKDVPSGKPYKIVDISEIPVDRTFRGAWAIADSLLTDGVGSDVNVFPGEAV